MNFASNRSMNDSHAFLQILSWTAVLLLSVSYWFQIWKIHVHKEVRDLSMIYHILLATGFGILTYTALLEDSKIFLVKQIMTTIPVCVIIAQIIIHRDHHWHDDADPICQNCGEELEPFWVHCAYCGEKKSDEPEVGSDTQVASQGPKISTREYRRRRTSAARSATPRQPEL